MMIACLIFIAGSIVMCAVQDKTMLIIARVVNGSGVGLLTSQGYDPIHPCPQTIY